MLFSKKGSVEDWKKTKLMFKMLKQERDIE